MKSCKVVENFCDEFKELLNSLLLYVIKNYIKTDKMVLMIGARSFGVLRRNKDKLVGAKKNQFMQPCDWLLEFICVFVKSIVIKEKPS